MADSIHNQVRAKLSQSRLQRNPEGIRLMRKSDIVHIDRILGAGAFSQVSAVTTKDGRRYACKHLKPDLMAQPDQFQTAAADLAYEAHMLAAFDHPNILKIRGWAHNGIACFEDGRHNSFFLLLDLLDETLDQRIERWIQEDEQARLQLSYSSFQPSNPEDDHHQVLSMRYQKQYLEKLQVVMEIASALNYIHERGVIFRDLKPNNIGFLGNEVKIFDFGLSRELPALDTSIPFEMSGKVGTIRYMAPEVVLHQPYNIHADVYSWSMVAYETLSLEKPYNGLTPDMHTDFVCRRGMRPDTANCRQGIPMEMLLLLQHAWHGDQARRPGLNYITLQLRLFQQKQRLILEDHELKIQLRRQLKLQRQAQQQPAVVAMDVNMSYFLAQSSTRKFHRCDSMGSIDTGSLSSDSLGW
jgi:serine/threonine protein kinase